MEVVFNNRETCKYQGRTEMKPLRNERGIALVMVLILSAISLAIMAGLIYMLTSATQVSGLQKRYATSLEAAHGGSDAIFRYIGVRGNLENFPALANIAFNSSCLADKLNLSTANWNASCDKTSTVSSSLYDISFSLGGSPSQYNIYAKIIDTVEGNTGPDDELGGAGVVEANKPTVVKKPYLYTIEVQSENAANPSERSKLSILYQH